MVIVRRFLKIRLTKVWVHLIRGDPVPSNARFNGLGPNWSRDLSDPILPLPCQIIILTLLIVHTHVGLLKTLVPGTTEIVFKIG